MSENFKNRITEDLQDALRLAREALPTHGPEDLMRIDMHCHDRNSDVPDETMGRLLRLPETWLPPRELVRTLRRHGSDVITITNHNNARSCWDLLDKGEDILSAAEFSCTLPDVGVGVHVLTFGFTPDEETKLNALRKNLYKFQAFTMERNIPTVLAHPLHFYAPGKIPDPSLMQRFALLFERFEGLNGQRDAWQNLLTMEWIKGLGVERLEAMQRRLGLDSADFCRNPFAKRLTGGSDCHFGMFAGATGTLLHAPGWRAEVQRGRKTSEIALGVLRTGSFVPFGAPCAEEKLTAAFLEYFSQAALRMEDPGLVRLLLHKGEPGEKLNAFLIGNALMELRRHKRTSRFLKVFSRGLRGKRPAWWMHLLTSKDYRPLLVDIDTLARARRTSPEANIAAFRETLPRMFLSLQKILLGRVETKLRPFTVPADGTVPGKRPVPSLTFAQALEHFELPIHFRAWTAKNSKRPKRPRTDARDRDSDAPHTAETSLGNLTDGLPFPFLASAVLGGATYAAHAVLNDRRTFVDDFAARIGRVRPAPRTLWLTDTLYDKNGVSHALQATLDEVRRRNLPIDFLACNVPEGKEGDHLISVPALSELRFPFYPDQPFRMPDLMQVQKIFQEGDYDRIICSTEAPMGLVALYLKHAFAVPAHFYVHTDWMDFTRRNLDLDVHQSDRLRRILRAFYGAFDGLYLLNTEQRETFASPEFGIPREKLHLTAHWTRPQFVPQMPVRTTVYPDLAEGTKVLLFAGRLSAEKGLRDLPAVLARVRTEIPDAVLAFAGTGPMEAELRVAFPDARFLGWLPAEKLAEAFAASDLLLLPSWFDTFSCVLLEAMACGLPAIAYDTKGPRDLILEGVTGFHAGSAEEMGTLAVHYLSRPHLTATFRRASVERAAGFDATAILDRLLEDLETPRAPQRHTDGSRHQQVVIQHPAPRLAATTHRV
jgi:glycosyltransferase involved in cell wall biosynthesis